MRVGRCRVNGAESGFMIYRYGRRARTGAAGRKITTGRGVTHAKENRTRVDAGNDHAAWPRHLQL